MLGLGGVPVVCGECYKLGKLIGLLLLFCTPPPPYFVVVFYSNLIRTHMAARSEEETLNLIERASENYILGVLHFPVIAQTYNEKTNISSTAAFTLAWACSRNVLERQA